MMITSCLVLLFKIIKVIWEWKEAKKITIDFVVKYFSKLTDVMAEFTKVYKYNDDKSITYE